MDKVWEKVKIFWTDNKIMEIKQEVKTPQMRESMVEALDNISWKFGLFETPLSIAFLFPVYNIAERDMMMKESRGMSAILKINNNK